MRVDVLIVEDEPVVAESATRVLQAEGLSVAVAGDARTAVDEIQRTAFKVVLCDLMLPGDSGFRILEWSRDLHPRTEIIIITGYATCENVLDSFRNGAFDFIPKPFDIGELLAPVSRALRFFDTPTTSTSPEPIPTTNASDNRDQSPGYHLLGRHSWACKDPDGSVTLGIGKSFPGLLGGTSVIDIAAPDEHLLQCRPFATLGSRDRLQHRVLAPLSGRVIAVNQSLAEEPSELDRRHWTSCWLVRIIPENPTEEFSSLDSH